MVPMPLQLRNTLGRARTPIAPSDGSRVRMYTCGPTVYRYAHVGNLRSYLLADFIRRTLLYHGLDVLHVKNITDVGHLRDERLERGEDRMLVAAGLEGRSPAEIAAAYEAAFHEDEAAVNILPAHVFPRATEHVPDIVSLVERIVESGRGYVAPTGNVYFDVSADPDYGVLSGNTLDQLRAGHRDRVEQDKDDPADFALWRAAGQGRLLQWSSPWGDGFPGWHIECSAMSMRYLGPRFDIHTGGEDNVFPHHEGEIAQVRAVTGDVPARVWVHGAHLLASGRKMAKSAGNFERVTELAERGIDPLAFRYLCLTVRHGRKLDYSETSLAAAAAGLTSLRNRLAALGAPPAEGRWAAPEPLRAGAASDQPTGIADGVLGHQSPGGASTAAFERRDRASEPAAKLSPAGRALHDRFVAAVDDDLDIPAALALVRETVRADLPADERRWLVLDADVVLGLGLDGVWSEPAPTSREDAPPEIADLLSQRDRARAARDWATADALRDELAEQGIEVTDSPSGTTWRRVERV